MIGVAVRAPAVVVAHLHLLGLGRSVQFPCSGCGSSRVVGVAVRAPWVWRSARRGCESSRAVGVAVCAPWLWQSCAVGVGVPVPWVWEFPRRGCGSSRAGAVAECSVRCVVGSSNRHGVGSHA